jgi:hypothetical protein
VALENENAADNSSRWRKGETYLRWATVLAQTDAAAPDVDRYVEEGRKLFAAISTKPMRDKGMERVAETGREIADIRPQVPGMAEASHDRTA